ncbi:MAG: hypothetical protein LKJ75_11480 [Clostridia bacterium]|jgi:hypothetical protein|nr:hypothetical protein [Clostridia bacterium]MCI2015811.1 hypothetical protein [Clostridia bacterium]
MISMQSKILVKIKEENYISYGDLLNFMIKTYGYNINDVHSVLMCLIDAHYITSSNSDVYNSCLSLSDSGILYVLTDIEFNEKLKIEQRKNSFWRIITITISLISAVSVFWQAFYNHLIH